MSRAEQTAIAQVVAGKRQYTQLMALFENWDMFQANLNLAENSEGALQGMADIYAESWEAASARVQASMEGIFNSLINDQGLIKLTNFTADFVDGIGSAIDSIGGLPGAIGLVGVALTKAFSPQLTASLDNIVYKFNNITGANVKNSKAVKESFFEEAEKISYDDGTNAGAATADAMSN
jgi:hypothetical protein